jgi:CheY-like chemotaxis protein
MASTEPASSNILVVDDDRNLLATIERSLERFYKVRVTDAPSEEVLRERPFDVVVADYAMPKMNGIEFLALVRQVRPAAARLLMTGITSFPDTLRAANGLEGLVRKPFTTPMLNDAIAQALLDRATRVEEEEAEALTQRRKILIVDDSLTAIEATELALKDAGYHPVGLNDPFRLIEFIRRERPAAILLDVSMPALDGPRLVEVMRQFDFLAGAKIILHSAGAEAQLRRQAAQSGADGYLRKSNDPEVYRRALERLLGA